MRTIQFFEGNRSGNELHIELPGCTVNIMVGLTDRLGRAVTYVSVSPEDEGRGGDRRGYCWRRADETRIIRDLEPGMHGQPSGTAEDCRHCGARIEQGDDHLWADVTDGWAGELDETRSEDDRLECAKAPRRAPDYPGLHEPAVPDNRPFESGELVEYVSHRTGPGGNSGQWVPGAFRDYGPNRLYATTRTLHNALRGHGGYVLCLSAEVRRIPAELVSAARSWAADCEWADGEDIADLTDLQVVAGVQRHYEGGWAAFRAASRAH